MDTAIHPSLSDRFCSQILHPLLLEHGEERLHCMLIMTFFVWHPAETQLTIQSNQGFFLACCSFEAFSNSQNVTIIITIIAMIDRWMDTVRLLERTKGTRSALKSIPFIALVWLIFRACPGRAMHLIHLLTLCSFFLRSYHAVGKVG